MLDAIVAKTGPPVGRHLMAFISGTGDHELVYDVSIMNFIIEITSDFNSMLNTVQREARRWEYTGTHASQDLFFIDIYFYAQC